MTNDAFQELWKREPSAPLRTPIDEIVRRNRRVATDVRNFSVQVSIAAVFNVVMWAAFAVIFSGLARAGALVALAGWAVAIGEVVTHRRRTLALAARMADLPALTFYRKALERERAFNRTGARWRRLVGFVAGPLVFMYGSTKGDPNGPIVLAIVGGLWIALHVLGTVAGRRRAQAIQRQIDEVDRDLR